MTPRLTRRAALGTAAFGTAAALSPLRTAQAALPLQGGGQPLSQRFRLGSFEITVLLAGTRLMENPFETFMLNATEDQRAAAARAAFLPQTFSRNYMLPVLLNTGREQVLFDTGLTAEGLSAALAAAGVGPEQIDLVVLSHMHGDHIGGLSGTGFANARYACGDLEWQHWAAAGHVGFDQKVRPLEAQMRRLTDGEEVVPGVTALLAPGHTPGHLIFHIESEGLRLMLTADLTNHFAFSLPDPDWEVRFDQDKPGAAASRRRFLSLIADEKLPFIGYHMPFPGLGYLERAGTGFRWIAHSYQLSVDP